MSTRAGESDARARRQSAVVATAAAALFLLGFRQAVSSNITTGLVVVIGLAPVWLPALRRYRGARPVVVLAGLSIIAGALLALGSVDHVIDQRNGIASILQLVTEFGGVGLVLWARQKMPVYRVAFWYALGSLASGVLSIPGSANPWKYELATPVTVLVLSLAGRFVARSQSLAATVGALCALGVISIANDYRSNFGMCAVAVMLVLWHSRPTGQQRRLGEVSTMVLLGGLVAAVYYGATALLVRGFLGAGLQARSEMQIRESGSLLAGGRPEWYGTWQLMHFRPWGFGVGAVPNPEDVLIAKGGLVEVGVPSNNGYVDHYMFGGQFKLHSTAADLWAGFGPVGLVLALVVAVLLVNSLTTHLVAHEPSALLALLVLLAVWNLAFGPIHTNLADITFALGLVLVPNAPRGPRIPSRPIPTVRHIDSRRPQHA